MQRAFGISRGAGGVDDDGGSSADVSTLAKSSGASSIAAQNDLAPAWTAPEVT